MMKSLKKLVMLLLVMMLAFAMVACGADDDDDSSSKKRDKTEKTDDKDKDDKDKDKDDDKLPASLGTDMLQGTWSGEKTISLEQFMEEMNESDDDVDMLLDLFKEMDMEPIVYIEMSFTFKGDSDVKMEYSFDASEFGECITKMLSDEKYAMKFFATVTGMSESDLESYLGMAGLGIKDLVAQMGDSLEGISDGMSQADSNESTYKIDNGRVIIDDSDEVVLVYDGNGTMKLEVSDSVTDSEFAIFKNFVLKKN